MAYLHFDSKYAPSGFLIVRDDANPYSTDPADTILVQNDWDVPGIASRIGYVPCECGTTDGTVSCAHRTVSDMISEAYNFLRKCAGERFATLDDYLDTM